MAWGDFSKKFQIKSKNVHFVLFHLIFSCYYCSKEFNRQSEHSIHFNSRPDTSSLVHIAKRVMQNIPHNNIVPKRNEASEWDRS